MTTLYERIGGEAAIDAAVDLFYARVLADERIKHFFNDVDMEKQIGHQKRFLTYAFGGGSRYEGRPMQAAHRRLVEEKGLNDTHFDAVMDNLGGTLKELGVPDDLISEAAAIAESVRDDVLNRETAPQAAAV